VTAGDYFSKCAISAWPGVRVDQIRSGKRRRPAAASQIKDIAAPDARKRETARSKAARNRATTAATVAAAGIDLARRTHKLLDGPSRQSCAMSRSRPALSRCYRYEPRPRVGQPSPHCVPPPSSAITLTVCLQHTNREPNYRVRQLEFWTSAFQWECRERTN